MPARDNRIVTIDLSTLNADPGVQRDVGGRIFQVLNYPVGMTGVTVTVDDDPSSSAIPLTGALKLQAQDGKPDFSRVTFKGPAQAGTLQVYLGNDPVPLFSAGPGDAGSLRYLDYLWLPHRTMSSGGAVDYTALAKGGAEMLAFLAQFVTGTGQNPVATVRNGRAVALLRPAGGRSIIYTAYGIPWVRQQTDVTTALRSVRDHPDATHQSYHLEVELGMDGALPGAETLGSGLVLVPTDGVIANDGHPDSAITPNAFFGIGADGAGGYAILARAVTGGALTVNDSITAALVAAGWPQAVRLHIQLQDADFASQRDGTVTVYVNENPVKTYTNMSLFPQPFNNGTPTSTTFRAKVWQGGAAGHEYNVANFRLWTAKGTGVAQA